MSVEETSTEVPASRSSQLPNALIGLAFLVVAIVFAASSSWYDTFLTVHILFVVVWIGGGLFLTVNGILAERKRDPAEMVHLVKQAAFAGERIFAPAAIVVLAMGIAMVLNADYGFGHFWLIFGLLGFATSFVVGIAVLSPRARKLDALLASPGPEAPETQAAISEILLIARVDMAVLGLVIVDMVTKPFS